MLAASKACLPGQRRVAGGVDEASRRKRHVAIAGGETDLMHPAAIARHGAQDRTEQYGNVSFANGFLDPTRERDLIVHHHGRVRRTAAAVVQGALSAEIAQNVIGDAVGELMAMRPVGEQSAERADDGIDGLATERGKSVQQCDLATETGRLERRRNPGDACPEDADIGRYMSCRPARRPPNDAGRRRNLGLVHFLAGRVYVTDPEYRSFPGR